MSRTIKFDRSAHAVSILDRMDEMMREESLCDFTIKIGAEEIKTHRVVLAGASDYFRSMLRSDTKESQSSFVDMYNVDPESAKICINFIYNREVTIRAEKYENLMYVANMMQLKELCDFIYAELGKELDSRSFFETRRIADMYGSKKLGEYCMAFAEANLVPISKEDGFKMLDIEYVGKIINSEKLKITEEEKLEVVLRFVKVDKKWGEELTGMIEWVDLSKVSSERKEELLKNEPLVSNNFKVYKIFTASTIDTLKEKLQTDQSDNRTSAVQAKVTNELELHDNVPKKTGYVQHAANSQKGHTSGIQATQTDGSTSTSQLGAAHCESNIVLFDKTSEHLLRFNPRDNTVSQMKEMFDGMKRGDYSAVAVDDYVCVLKEKNFHRFKCSDATSPWEQMPDMMYYHGPRPPVTAAMGCMYVCGGSALTKTEAFEKFDLKEGLWEKLKEKPELSSSSTILAFNEIVYSIGGIVMSCLTNKVEKFDLALSTWMEIAPMINKRRSAAAVEANGNIFVSGGYDTRRHGEEANLCVAERYCPSFNQWTEIKSMKIARHRLKAFAIDGAIYSVGGWACDSPKSVIEKYQIQEDEWETVELSSTEGELRIYDSVEIKI